MALNISLGADGILRAVLKENPVAQDYADFFTEYAKLVNETIPVTALLDMRSVKGYPDKEIVEIIRTKMQLLRPKDKADKTSLIIDASPLIKMLASSIVTLSGFAYVKICSTEQEALDKLKR